MRAGSTDDLESAPDLIKVHLPRVQPRSEGGGAHDRRVVGAFILNLARRVHKIGFCFHIIGNLETMHD